MSPISPTSGGHRRTQVCLSTAVTTVYLYFSYVLHSTIGAWQGLSARARFCSGNGANNLEPRTTATTLQQHERGRVYLVALIDLPNYYERVFHFSYHRCEKERTHYHSRATYTYVNIIGQNTRTGVRQIGGGGGGGEGTPTNGTAVQQRCIRWRSLCCMAFLLLCFFVFFLLAR